VLAYAINDKRKFVFISTEISAKYTTFLSTQTEEVQKRIAFLRIIKTLEASGEDGYNKDLVYSKNNFEVLFCGHLSKTQAITKEEGDVLLDISLLEILTIHCGSNSVLYSVDSDPELVHSLEENAIQRLLFSYPGKDNNISTLFPSGHPLLAQLITKKKENDNGEEKEDFVLLGSTVGNDIGFHSLWKVDVWTPTIPELEK